MKSCSLFIVYISIHLIIIDGTISPDYFLSIIGIFVFGTLEQQVRVLLSACGIHSNVCLSRQQTLQFLISINPKIIKDSLISDYIDEYLTSDQVSVCDICTIGRVYPMIFHQFVLLKTALIDNFIGRSCYISVQNRVYHYRLLGKDVIIGYDDVSLSSRICTAITCCQPPYYTDYPGDNSSMDVVAIKIRNLFGYSRRKVISIRVMLKKSACLGRYESGHSQIHYKRGSLAGIREEEMVKI